MQTASARRRPIKIALNGAHGTGKTTLINTLETQCAERGVKVEIVREIPRLICDSVADPAFFRQENNTFAKQTLLLQGQLQAELGAISGSPDLILCDRAVLDHWIYTTHFHRSALQQSGVLQAYTAMVVQHCQTYDAIFYVPVEFAPIDDGVREADAEFQRSIDRDIRGFLEANRLVFTTVTGTVDARCASVLAFIDARLSSRRASRSSTKSKSSGTRIGSVELVVDADAAYRRVLTDLLATDHEITGSDGKSVGSNRRSKEILNYSVVIENPRERLISNLRHKINLPSAVARFVWMMAGNDRLKDIEFYEKKVGGFTDDGIVVPGSSYGHRMIYPAPGCNQIEGVIERLKRDAATRRAAVAVYRAEDATRDSKDIPCTFGLAFHNRGEFIHTSVVMRSNNAFVLLPYNIFEFSLLGEAVAKEVGLELGSMTYHAMSMHLYSNNYENAQEVVNTDVPQPTVAVPVMPRDPSPMQQIRELVKIEADARHAAAGFSTKNFESDWLSYADSRLDAYWRQFYYVLLYAMCNRIEFNQGMLRLREFIDESWLSYLPPQPVIADHVKRTAVDVDLFPQSDLRTRSVAARQPSPRVRADSTALSRADLERELEQVLRLYQPHVAKNDWARVTEYRSVFLQKATESPEKMGRIFGRLQRFRFSLGKAEKVEMTRARAESIIGRLEKLAID
jgi:thymidylate synthase/nicotinamide riboside kinase